MNNSNILFSKLAEQNEIRNSNNYAMNQVKELKRFYPDCMIWYKPICGHMIWIVVDPSDRSVIEVMDAVSENGVELSDNDLNDYIGEIIDSLSVENINKEPKFDRNYSIERFLEENVELANQVSLDIQLEEERFYDSNFFD